MSARHPPGCDALVIDTETTGLDDDARIVALGAALVTGGVPTAALASLVHPGEEALARQSAESLAVHGLCAEKLTQAPPFRSVWSELLALAAPLPPATPVLAHNAPFDRARILFELGTEDDPVLSRPWVDTLERARTELGAGAAHARFGLDALCARFSLPVRTTRHDAADDAMRLARLWCAWGAAHRRTQHDLFTTTCDDTQPMAPILPIEQHSEGLTPIST